MPITQRIKHYVEAVTCLGRHLRGPDQYGPWSAAYHFNRDVKARVAAGRCPPSLFEAVKDLPYFLSNSLTEYNILLAQQVVAFKTMHGRRPRRFSIGEVRDYTALKVLLRAHREGRLHESLISLLLQHDLMPKYSRRSWSEAFEALRTFVEDQKRMPSAISADQEERRLASVVKHIRNQDKNGRLSPDQRRDVSSTPCILTRQARGRPIGRGPK